MTMIQINIPDDLKDAINFARPGETIEQAVINLLRAKLGKANPEMSADARQVWDRLAHLRSQSRPITDTEIRALREEGRP